MTTTHSAVEPKTISASEIIRYVVCHHKTRDVFPGWSRDQLEYFTLEHVVDDAVAISIVNNVIVGAVFFSEQSKEKALVIEAIYCDIPVVFPSLLRACEIRYPSWSLKASRHGRNITYTPRHMTMMRRMNPVTTVSNHEQ